jgi:hypothetical protein
MADEAWVVDGVCGAGGAGVAVVSDGAGLPRPLMGGAGRRRLGAVLNRRKGLGGRVWSMCTLGDTLQWTWRCVRCAHVIF